MSLNWSLSEVENFKSLWVPSPVKGEEDREVLHGVTESLIWATMAVDLGKITAENVDEWCWRLAYLQAIGKGEFLIEWSEDDDGKEVRRERNFTRAEVERHIGLRTNVTTMPRRSWIAKWTRSMSRDADASVRRGPLARVSN